MLTNLQTRVADRCGVGVRNVALSQILIRAERTVHQRHFGPHAQPAAPHFLRHRHLMLMNMRQIACPAAKCSFCAGGGSQTRVVSNVRFSATGFSPDFTRFSHIFAYAAIVNRPIRMHRHILK